MPLSAFSRTAPLNLLCAAFLFIPVRFQGDGGLVHFFSLARPFVYYYGGHGVSQFSGPDLDTFVMYFLDMADDRGPPHVRQNPRITQFLPNNPPFYPGRRVSRDNSILRMISDGHAFLPPLALERRAP
ncbi:hypothetical protein BC827DRAFT_1202676 [Russula dissimulans]|nr:hypothetical protein BC827DRAFT_1202676 [Russula dissimulans]